MSESFVEKTVCKQAELRGWLVRKVSWIGRRNAMDRLFVRQGRTLWIEFKAPGEKPRPGQENEMSRFKKAGAEVYVVDNIEQGLAIFAEPGRP